MLKKWLCLLPVLFSVTAYAVESGDTIFSAKVFTGTCDIETYVDGVPAKDIPLGIVTLGMMGPQKTFVIKAADPAKPECHIFATSGKYSKARVTLVSGAMNKKGLGNWLGTATDAWVKITPANATDNKDIVFGDDVRLFDIGKLIGEGFQFKASLKGEAKSGTYQSGVALTVAYLA